MSKDYERLCAASEAFAYAAILCLHAQMPTRFLEGRLHLPTHDEPPKDLLGLGIKLSA
jgi:hypothetical protein